MCKSILLLAMVGALSACQPSYNTIPIIPEEDQPKVIVADGVYVFEDTMAMDSYTEAEQEALAALFE